MKLLAHGMLVATAVNQAIYWSLYFDGIHLSNTAALALGFASGVGGMCLVLAAEWRRL